MGNVKVATATLRNVLVFAQRVSDKYEIINKKLTRIAPLGT
jgi:hypothetical protein